MDRGRWRSCGSNGNLRRTCHRPPQLRIYRLLRTGLWLYLGLQYYPVSKEHNRSSHLVLVQSRNNLPSRTLSSVTFLYLKQAIRIRIKAIYDPIVYGLGWLGPRIRSEQLASKVWGWIYLSHLSELSCPSHIHWLIWGLDLWMARCNYQHNHFESYAMLTS